MARLIDADELKNAFGYAPIELLVDREWILHQIDSAQTVDAVPIVRCKDCMFWHDDGIITTCDVNIGHGFAENWFCADGKRKGGEHDA